MIALTIVLGFLAVAHASKSSSSSSSSSSDDDHLVQVNAADGVTYVLGDNSDVLDVALVTSLQAAAVGKQLSALNSAISAAQDAAADSAAANAAAAAGAQSAAQAANQAAVDAGAAAAAATAAAAAAQTAGDTAEQGVAQVFDVLGENASSGMRLPALGYPREYVFPAVTLGTADEIQAPREAALTAGPAGGSNVGLSSGFASVAVRDDFLELDISLRGGLVFAGAVPDGGALVSALHLHRAVVNEGAPVLVDLLAATQDQFTFVLSEGNTRISGAYPLDQTPLTNCPAGQTAAECMLSALFSASIYINVHTTRLTGGELRGQVVPAQPRPVAALGSNEVPAVTNAAGRAVFTSSVANVVLDRSAAQRVTGTLSFTATFFGYRFGAIGDAAAPEIRRLHLHNARAGANGPVVAAIIEDRSAGDTASTQAPAAVTGVTLAAVAVTGGVRIVANVPLNFAAFQAPGLYYNMHTVANPAGELRAQLFEVDFVERA